MIRTIIFLGLLSLVSCKSKYNTGYYEDGNIKYKVEILNGKKHGTQKNFYPDGTLREESRWIKGVQHGITRYYYPNGTLEAEVMWENGRQDGITVEYYKNGQISVKGTFREGKVIGEMQFYGQDGTLVEKHLYLSPDHVDYMVGYDSLGNKEFEMVYPLFMKEKDTININEPYEAILKFQFPIKGDLNVYIGEDNPEGNTFIYDEQLREVGHNKFELSIKDHKIGKNEVQILIEHLHNDKDTVNFNSQIIDHIYYVEDDQPEV